MVILNYSNNDTELMETKKNAEVRGFKPVWVVSLPCTRRLLIKVMNSKESKIL